MVCHYRCKFVVKIFMLVTVISLILKFIAHHENKSGRFDKHSYENKHPKFTVDQLDDCSFIEGEQNQRNLWD